MDLLKSHPSTTNATFNWMLFLQGLYENFLSMRVRDPNLQSVCEALDWLLFSDRLNQEILRGQNFSLMKYLPFLSVTFHFLFAHTTVPRISYPHGHHEVGNSLHEQILRSSRGEKVQTSLFGCVQASSRLLSSRNALSTMLVDIPAAIRTRISQLTLTLDVLTLLLDIICPKLRPVCKSHLYGPDLTFESVISILLAPKLLFCTFATAS